MSVQPHAEERAGQPAGAVPPVVQQLPVSASLRALSPMADADYVDAFTMAGGLAGRTPEQWARAMFEVVGGRGAQVIWRGILGMRLRPAPDRIAGWAIGDRGDGWVRLEASSWFMAGQLLVQATDDQVSFATFIRYRRPWAGYLWTPLSAAHRRLSPGLLTGAYELLRTLS